MTAKQDGLPLTERKVVRRGLIAGLAGLGAAAMMKLTGAEKASAADGDFVRVGQTNSGSNLGAVTRIVNNPPTQSTTFAAMNSADSSVNVLDCGIQGLTDKSFGFANGVYGVNRSGTGGAGVVGDGPATGVGVIGRATSSFSAGDQIPRVRVGVEGLVEDPAGIAVAGINGSSGTGVYGISNATDFLATGNGSGTGVHGKSGSGTGVLGEGTLGASGFGVRGYAQQNGTGVKGVSNNGGDLSTNGTGSGIGVEGRSGSGLGVRGVSTSFVGVVGISTGSHGLYGSSGSASGVGLVGENTGGGLAGVFNAGVQIYGALQVFGAKNAVIKMADGTNAAMYSQESPEPWWEDFGRAQLVGGVANVAIEREFATLVAGGDYHVFCFPEGLSGGLYVSRRGPAGFEVRDPSNGNAAFSYRIVTKRKDIEGRRFARVSDDGAKSVAAARAALGVNGGAPTPNPPSQPVPPFVPPVSPPPPVTSPGLTDGNQPRTER